MTTNGPAGDRLAERDGVDKQGDHGGCAWLIRAALEYTHRKLKDGRSRCGWRDWREVYEEFDNESLRQQATRCM